MDLLKYAQSAIVEAGAVMDFTLRHASNDNRPRIPRDLLTTRQKLPRVTTTVPLYDLPSTLIISGGGMKAFYMLGALSTIHEDGLLKQVKKFAGTSVGALIGTTLLLGYRPIDVLAQALWMPSLKKVRPKTITELLGVIFSASRDCFEEIFEMLGLLFEHRGLSRNVTFSELYEASRGRELLVVATRLERYSLSQAIFSMTTTPNMPVIVAVRASCTVPVLLDPVVYENQVFVDGCLVNNFPVDTAIDAWLDGSPALAVGIDKGRPIVHAESVSYVLIPISAKHGEGLLGCNSDRLDMYVHGRAAMGVRRRRYSV